MRATAIALLGSLWIAGAAAQSAPMRDSKPYMSALVTGSSSVEGPAPANANPLNSQVTGLGLALAIGYRWLPVRAELEYQLFSSTNFLVSDVLTITALTANAILEWQVTEPVGAYVAAGLGGAHANLSGDNGTSGNGYAGQVQAGIAFGKPSGFQLLLGFRRFATGHLGLTDGQGRPFENDKVRMSMAQIGIRSNF